MAEGEDVALGHLVMALEKGPPSARIDEVITSYHVPAASPAQVATTEVEPAALRPKRTGLDRH
jgi:hypothetical protein